MGFPKEILAITKEADAKYPANSQKATAWAERRVRKLPIFESVVKMLVSNMLQELIFDARNTANSNIRDSSKEYGQPAKTVSGKSKLVNRAASSVYSFRIAGNILGLVLGKELEGIANGEEGRANGHMFRSKLCRALMNIVPEDKTVQESVSEKKLRSIFNKLEKEFGRDAA